MNKEYKGGYAADFHDSRGVGKAQSANGGSLTSLERLSHVMEKVYSLWGKKEFNLYVQSLLMDSRGGTRQGFPPEVAQDLLMLAEINTIGRALLIARKMNVPYRDALRKLEAELEDADASPFSDPQSSRETARYGNRVAGRGDRQAAESVTPPPASGGGMADFVMAILFNRYTLMLVVALVAGRLLWSRFFS